MHRDSIRRIAIYDQGSVDDPHPSFLENLTAMKRIFRGNDVEFIRVCISEKNHMRAARLAETIIREEDPDIVVIAATAAGEELAPMLGVRLRTGVAAHCSDITINESGNVSYMVPAFGGRVVDEIFIDTRPAIATVKPGVFSADESMISGYRTCLGMSDDRNCGESFGSETKLISYEEAQHKRSDIVKADLVLCAGRGVASEENWKKLEAIAEKTGGAVGCTRPVTDTEWGPDEYSMIGTSGMSIGPKVYVGFGVSGAAHHMCGIKDAGTVISVNSDGNAEVFSSSDYRAVSDGNAVIDALAEILDASI